MGSLAASPFSGLDLGFTAVECVELDAPLPELQELSLRIIKTPLRQVRVGESKIGVGTIRNQKCGIQNYGYKPPPFSQNFGLQPGFLLPFLGFVAKQTYLLKPMMWDLTLCP